MKNQRLSILLLLSLNICFIAQGQINTSISDKVICKTYEEEAYPFHDYDNNDNLWFAHRTDNAITLYQIDNNLNIIDSIVNSTSPIYPLYFKKNDMLYGTAGVIKPDTHVNNYVIDSMVFFSNDLDGRVTNTKMIFSESENENSIANVLPVNSFLTKDNNIAILLMAVEADIDWIFPRLLIVDSLGERIALKDFETLRGKRQSKAYYISEKDSNFVIYQMIAGFWDLYSTNTYYIDKTTLEIIDSASFETPFSIFNFKPINDSIFVSICPSGSRLTTEPERYYIYIANDKQMKLTSKIKIEHDNLSFRDVWSQNYQSKIDFRNEDSIYFCTFLSKNTGIYDQNYSGLVQVLNFGTDGTVNFDYKFILDSLSPFQINGVKATSDGGLFVTLYAFFSSSTYIIKFMPNGFIGLVNIETGEKETIKVYPNPARDYINVDIQSTNFKQSDIELFDMQGKLVKKAKLKSKQGNRIDVSNLNAGAYTYNVSLNGKTISGKIIVGK